VVSGVLFNICEMCDYRSDRIHSKTVDCYERIIEKKNRKIQKLEYEISDLKRQNELLLMQNERLSQNDN